MANKGTSTFIIQRLSAMAVLPLVIWFLISLVFHAGDSYEETVSWLSNPAAAIPLGLLVIAGAIHMRIGIMEVIEDYIHSGLKTVLLALNWLFALTVAATALWSIYQLAFAG